MAGLINNNAWDKTRDIIVVCVIPFAGWMWSISGDSAESRRAIKELQEDCRKYEAQIESLKAQDVEFKVINARIETRLDAIDANIAEIKILLKERLK